MAKIKRPYTCSNYNPLLLENADVIATGLSPALNFQIVAATGGVRKTTFKMYASKTDTEALPADEPVKLLRTYSVDTSGPQSSTQQTYDQWAELFTTAWQTGYHLKALCTVKATGGILPADMIDAPDTVIDA